MAHPRDIRPLKPGYKQTAEGVIPEDWEVTSFHGLMDFRNGVNADGDAYGKGIRFVNVLEAITNSHLRAGDIPGRVTLSKSAIESFSIRRGDVVFNRTSETQEEVGLAAVYLDDEEVVFGGFVIRGRPKTDSLDSIFAGYALRSPRIRSQIISKGQGAIRANISQTDLRQVLAILPPLPEQRAIAAALGDVDALIGALDRLIAKKRDLKQAAMQQLLTGQTRLPGFHGEWEVKRLKGIVQTPVTDGPHSTPEFLTDGIPFLSVNNLVDNSIDLTELRFISAADHEFFSRKCKPQNGDILLGKAASVGKVAIVESEMEFNIWSPIALIRVRSDTFARFVYYQLQSADLVGQIALLTNSSSQGNIGMGDIEKLMLRLPSLPEQTAIAAVLSDMDAEISALEARRDKTRLLKQGMMQELLTGKTRLV